MAAALQTIRLDGETLSLEEVRVLARGRGRAEIDPGARERIRTARHFVDEIVEEGRVVYGVTTGFGKFADVTIDRSEVLTLQRNLVLSHCCGVGEPLGEEETRALMVLRANVLAKGYSGARFEVLETLVEMINRGVYPVVPAKGSVGASGDLAPLAHVAAVMIGEGEAFLDGKRVPGAEAMAAAGIEPLVLEAKEGLGLINGTQLMTGLGSLSLLAAENLLKCADIAGAMTLEALRGTDAAYLPRTHEVRPHPGQLATARNLMRLLTGSEILPSHRDAETDRRVQDAYSLRCMPQVHGAAKDAAAYVRRVLEIEVNSTTDNPLVFAEEGLVVSGGNFHGQPVSQAMDFLAVALTYLAGISERRVEYLLDPATSERLPAFLTPRGGLNSGLMIPQVTAAALVSENKTLAHPACVDSIPTSANKEDYVSMGAYAARKAGEVVRNATLVVAVELLSAAQALEFGEGLRPGRGVQAVYELIREKVPPLAEDREQTPDIEAIARLIEEEQIRRAAEEEVGPLEPA
ncbi:MAG: histidine ammonia-lyase [Thermoleophilia bacterium]